VAAWVVARNQIRQKPLEGIGSLDVLPNERLKRSAATAALARSASRCSGRGRVSRSTATFGTGCPHDRLLLGSHLTDLDMMEGGCHHTG